MTAADFDQVRAIALAQQGLSQQDLPDFGNNVLTKRVVESGNEIVCAALARVEVMAHIYMDPAWSTPRMRLEAFKLLHREMTRELAEKGIEIVHAEVESRAFIRRLKDLGWERPVAEQLLLQISPQLLASRH